MSSASDLILSIRSDWDTSLTYDQAYEPPNPEPIFVGRAELLDFLVETLAQPERRGAFLVSGYRGSGKTTLLAEAVRRAQKRLAFDQKRPFLVVLHASEVCASLDFGEHGQQVPKLDARRLITGLLRALAHQVRTLERRKSNLSPSPELCKRIEETYLKAVAVEYRQALCARGSSEKKISWENSTTWSVVDLYRGLGGLGLLAASMLECYAWLGSFSKAAHPLAAALAGLSALSWSISRKAVRTQALAREKSLTVQFDNSLQQLEKDLQDLITDLYAEQMRVVVILEELDKLEDREGTQLDAVVRYFKNLFTQAPAIFFFVTDKTYFDLVTSRINNARRQRSYAIEHTFFAHRIFVGRPSTRDCLEFLQRIILDEKYRAALARIYQPEKRRLLPLDEMDLFARWARVMLFRAANHLFDLKAELRRFVRTVYHARSVICLDENSFPEDESALAVFQDLIVEKARIFAFPPSRAYANEVLNDSLYAVFSELGSSQPQYVSHFFPRNHRSQPVGAEHSPSSGHGDEQLDIEECRRIEAAVNSLVEDLGRGGALENRAAGSDSFVWKPGAAKNFQRSRRLENHEKDLLHQVRLLREKLKALAASGLFTRFSSPLNSRPSDSPSNITEKSAPIPQAGTTRIVARLDTPADPSANAHAETILGEPKTNLPARSHFRRNSFFSGPGSFVTGEKIILRSVDRLRIAELITRLSNREKSLIESEEQLTLETALQEGAYLDRQTEELIHEALREVRERVAQWFGLKFAPVAAEGVVLLHNREIQPGTLISGLTQASGACVFLEGDAQRFKGLFDFVQRSVSLKRLTIIHLCLQTEDGDGASRDYWEEKLEKSRPGLAVKIIHLSLGQALTITPEFTTPSLAAQMLLDAAWALEDLEVDAQMDESFSADHFRAAAHDWLSGKNRVLWFENCEADYQGALAIAWLLRTAIHSFRPKEIILLDVTGLGWRADRDLFANVGALLAQRLGVSATAPWLGDLIRFGIETERIIPLLWLPAEERTSSGLEFGLGSYSDLLANHGRGVLVSTESCAHYLPPPTSGLGLMQSSGKKLSVSIYSLNDDQSFPLPSTSSHQAATTA